MCFYNMHQVRPVRCSQWCMLFCSYVPCLIASGLILSNTAPYQFFFLPRLRASLVEGKVSILYYYYCVFMMLFAQFMVFFNYFRAIGTCPGYVPSEPWSRPPIFNGKAYSDNPYEVTQLDKDNKLRFCAKCDQFKPDNAHHCNFCGKCIYRMDHHCPWINNCVGRDNTKFFLLFVSYIPLGAFHIVFTTLYSSLYHLPGIHLFQFDGDIVTIVVLMGSMVFSLTMGIAFFSFAMHFVYMAYRGESSMSVSIARKIGKEKADKMLRQSREDQLYEIFGSDRRWWMLALPIAPKRDHRGLPGFSRNEALIEMQQLV